MIIGNWSNGVDTVEVDHEIVALLIHRHGTTEMLEFNPVKRMTTGKSFGIVTMDDVEKRFGKREQPKREEATKRRANKKRLTQPSLF